MAKDAGVPLKFTGEFEGKKVQEGIKKTFKDIEEEQKKSFERMRKMMADAAKSSKYGGSDQTTSKATNDQANATKNLTERQRASAEALKAERAAKLANIEAIAQYRQYLQQEKQAVQDAKKAYEQGRITLQTYRLEIVKANRAARERAKAEREAKKALAANSEYQKLNRALGELRTRSKNVLAEMFKLEGQGKKNTIAYHQLADEARGLVAQTQYLDRGLKKIDASLGLHQRNVGNYGSALDAISPQFARLNSQLAMMGVNLTEVSASKNGFKELGSVLVGVGRNIGAFLISPIGLAITALTSLYLLISRNFGTIKEFNAGLINVSKTTGIAGAELTRLGDSIIGLSRSLQVVGTDKLLEYATVAGQLGVKGTQNILAFTEALAKLETASDITGEEGGANIARMLTLVDGGVQNVKAFGDEIVNLGNNFAATEAEILDNATQIAQNVGIYKIGRQEVLAFATATKSVGIEAELVGSTFGRTLGQFEKIIRTGKGLADLLKVVGGNEKELAERFKSDASGVFVDYIRGLNNIDKAGGSVNAALAKTGVVAIRDQRVIASLATNGFDVLTDAINKSTDAVGALDTEFTNKAGSLESQIGRIKIAWNNLVLDIENGEGVLGQAVVRFADGLATILDRIAKLANPTGWNEFIASLTDFDQADMIREMNIAFTDAETTLKSLSSFDVSTANQDKLREKYAEIESATAALNKQYEIYKKAVNDGVLTEGGKARLDEYKRVLDDLSSYMWQLNRNIDPNATTPTGDTGNGNDPNPDTEAAKRAREAALNNQRQMQKQIDELNAASLRSTLEKDQQEVESVREKYRKIRQTIDEFRKDPKNKGFAVDASGLSAAEAREVAQVRYRQDTAALMKELGIQRQLWQDYETWRAALGKDSADKQFSNELEAIKSYRSRLDQEIAAIGAQLTASIFGGPVAAAALTGAEKERQDALIKERESVNKEIAKRDADNLKSLLTDYASYEKKRVRLREQANADMAGMDEEARKIRQKALEKELEDLYEAEINGNEKLQEFLKTVDTAGSSAALRAMKHGKDYVNTLIDGLKDATDAEKKKLTKLFADFFDQGIASLEQENFGNVVSLVDGFDQLVESAMQFDGTLGNSLKTIGSMVSQVGQLAKTLGQTFQEMGGSLAKSGGYGAIIGSIISAFGTIVSISEAATERQMQKIKEANDLQIQHLNAQTKLLERQLSIIKDIYGVERVEAYARTIYDTTKAINEGLSDIGDSTFALFTGDGLTRQGVSRFNSEFNGSIDELNKAIKKEEKKANNFWNILWGSSSTHKRNAQALKNLRDEILNGKTWETGWGTVADITQDGINKLYELIDGGGLDEVTAAKIQNIIDQYNLWREATNQLNEELTGTTFQSITDDIASMFESGKNSVEDFSDFFIEKMRKAVLMAFSRESIETQMQPWYDWLAELSKDGLTEGEIKMLREGGIWNDKEMKGWQELTDEMNRDWDIIRKVTGVNFDSDKNASSPNALSSGLTPCTEESINKMEILTRKFKLSCQHSEC